MAELPQKHRVSVSGVLKILGVSRSGYRAWKQRVPSVSEKHRDHIKDAIKQIYDGSHQNYGAPKITEMLHRQGESIAEKTVGNYMRQIYSIFSNLKNYKFMLTVHFIGAIYKL